MAYVFVGGVVAVRGVCALVAVHKLCTGLWPSALVWETGLSLNLEPVDSAGLAGHVTPSPLVSAPPVLGRGVESVL